MKIIVGLGNPGKKYEHTRHNLGWLVLDALHKDTDFSWTEFKEKKAWESLVSEGVFEEEKILLIKPLTFMNNSGVAIKKILQKTGATPDDLIVAHDELDLPSGKIKLEANRSAAGHNGVQSIINELNTKEFLRLRGGIGHNREHNLPAETYVLQKFSAAEQPTIEQLIIDAAHLIKSRLKKESDQ